MFEEMTGEVLQRLGRHKQANIDAIPTQFPSWNALCGEEGGYEGLAKGWLVIVGGADGTGKSNLAYNLAANATRQGKLSGVINFEMSQMQSGTRYVSILTGTPKYKLDQGKYYDAALWAKACAEVDRIAEETGGALITNQAAVFGLEDIHTAYGQLADAGCEMIVVDYAQLVSVKQQDGLFQRSEAVANALRELTHKHNVVTICISQFNRDTKTSDQPPTRFGLQGGSAWENNANQIVLLNHTLQCLTKDGRGKYTELIGDKNRHGPAPFKLPVKWNNACMRLEEYVPGTDPGDPFPPAEDGGVQMDARSSTRRAAEAPPEPVEDLFG